MITWLRRRRAAAPVVEFCESCGEVCTAACRAQARLERVRAEAPFLPGLLR